MVQINTKNVHAYCKFSPLTSAISLILSQGWHLLRIGGSSCSVTMCQSFSLRSPRAKRTDVDHAGASREASSPRTSSCRSTVSKTLTVLPTRQGKIIFPPWSSRCFKLELSSALSRVFPCHVRIPHPTKPRGLSNRTLVIDT